MRGRRDGGTAAGGVEDSGDRECWKNFQGVWSRRGGRGGKRASLMGLWQAEGKTASIQQQSQYVTGDTHAETG